MTKESEILSAIKSKYRNKKVIWKGEKFDSIKERDRYIYLLDQEKKGKIYYLNRQIKYSLIKKNKYYRGVDYIADFVYRKELPFSDAYYDEIVEDVKGYRRGAAYQLFKIKQKLMYEKYGIVVKEI